MTVFPLRLMDSRFLRQLRNRRNRLESINPLATALHTLPRFDKQEHLYQNICEWSPNL